MLEVLPYLPGSVSRTCSLEVEEVSEGSVSWVGQFEELLKIRLLEV